MNQTEATEQAIHAVEDIAMAWANALDAPPDADLRAASKVVILSASTILLSIVLSGDEFSFFVDHNNQRLTRVDMINMALHHNGIPWRLEPVHG